MNGDLATIYAGVVPGNSELVVETVDVDDYYVALLH